MNKKTLIWVGVGCVGLCLVVVVVAVALGGSFMKWVMQEPEDIQVDVTAPDFVSMGEEFVVEIEIMNTASSPQELNGIDVDTSYLDGIMVTGTEPSYVDMFVNDLIESMSFHSYYFRRDIASQETLTVKFFMKAFIVGDFSGTFDICIDTETNCLEYYVRTVVDE